MLISSLSTSLSLSALALSAAASPIRDPGAGTSASAAVQADHMGMEQSSVDAGMRGGQHQFKVALRRWKVEDQPGLPVQGEDSIFDPTFPEREIQGILLKYAKAPQFLQGIGLNPDDQIQAADSYKPGFETSATISEVEDDTDLPSSAPITDSSVAVNSSNSSASLPTSQLLPATATTPAGTAMMPLTDDISGTLDLDYYGPINVGTPAQTLTVDVDTGSADLWFPVDCQNCSGKEQFVPSRSSTHSNSNTKFSVTYGSGRVSGTLSTDVVSVGGLTVQKQSFGSVNQESGSFITSSGHSDGLIGMAFGTIASSKQPTFFENLMAEKQLAAPMFAIHLARKQVSGSEVCFGCQDSNKFVGPTRWIPVTSKTYWAVGMDAVVVNNAATSINIYAAIDTGTTLIYLPSNATSALYGMIPGSKAAPQYGDGYYTFPCKSTPDIEFSFNGSRFGLNMTDFNLGRTASGSSDCVGGVIGLGAGFPSNLAIVGDEFLKSWYSTYDYSNGARVGFARSINNAH